MFKKAAMSFALLGVVALMAGKLCHSQEFWLAKAKLEKMVLTPAQSKEIVAFEKDFQTKWQKSHSELGCRAHEMHSGEFIAAASGVLTNDQFRQFRGRNRNAVEGVGYSIRQTGQHINDLLTLAGNI